ncbi:hypothetical protein C9J85_02925 [Haloferax sp. wsp5]|nr:hypothetical protein C9J85_02925 [Haloferax sp. wsp5]
MLAGCASSAVASRVVTTVVNQAQVPIMLGPAASADITSNSETCSDLVYRAARTPRWTPARSGSTSPERRTNRASSSGADDGRPRGRQQLRDVLEAEGVDIVGERFVEQGYAEWDGLLDNAEEAGAEGVVGGFTVATLPATFNAFLSGEYSYRVSAGSHRSPTASSVGRCDVLGEPLPRHYQGLTARAVHDSLPLDQYDNPINDAFVESYTNAYGVVPDLFTAGTFTGASAIHQAVQESGSTEGADIADALKGMTVTDTPKGEDGYTFQEYNNQARRR